MSFSICTKSGGRLNFLRLQMEDLLGPIDTSTSLVASDMDESSTRQIQRNQQKDV
jgi:hypothetical protein